MMVLFIRTGAVALCVSRVMAINLNITNLTSIQEATGLILSGLMDYYQGYKKGGTVGMFTNPYYWWEAGGAWGSLIDFSYLMENDTYVDVISTSLQYQTGEQNNYMPLNQTTTEGNDDQGFWGLAVMAAAEKNFTNPKDPEKAWLALAQGVFNTMAARWDVAHCGGGLRWQIFQWNMGYDYKNSVSNGCLFNIGARLARYTGNDSYADWAEKVWDWMEEVELLKLQENWNLWFVYDGLNNTNCSHVTEIQWTYNQGLMLNGAAFLCNYTQEEKWCNRTENLLAGSVVFFNRTTENPVMYEAACQGATKSNCNNDQRSFKAYFARFLALTSVLVPSTRPTIDKYIQSSAVAAAQSCSGGTDGHTCGLNWSWKGWDGYWGLGEQMSALEVIQSLRVHDRPGPLTASTGGSSLGNPAAGFGTSNRDAEPLNLTSKDKAGAGIITALIGVSLTASFVWLII
ncbi:hydrolase 76 protein [Scheffersomyces spartinae]|uniref:Mannan endo-1,6-alpha-mannosidase n=1 Tax=Scheffersomyces spartinae TaxID=45513 RepID=A0A9P7VBC3_9ASCO|nr:hydrolase 76 protein [Scheffersomyces spartinae]KAG7194787.1 hydrolase 76 protein [Scheffersomyces spartinae]